MRFKTITAIALCAALCLALTAVKSSSSGSIDNGSADLIPRQPAVKPIHTYVGPNAIIDRVIVKLVEGSRGRISGRQINSLSGKNTGSLNEVLSRFSSREIKRMALKSPDLIEQERYSLEISSGHQLADLNNYFTINVASPAEAELLVNELNRLSIIEIAYPEPRPEPAVDLDPPTPSFDTAQFHLRPAPLGIDADYGRTIPGGEGNGIRIIDVEGKWVFDHEDLEIPLDHLYGGVLPELGHGGHGTAVVGELVAGDNGYGVVGIVPAAEMAMVSIYASSSMSEMDMTAALLIAMDSLHAGDIMLIELHAPGPRYGFQRPYGADGYVCMEYWQANFDIIQMAWAKGAIVCEAAGNGHEDFDDPIYERRFDTTFRNSHAIMCGAGSAPSDDPDSARMRLDFSNYGARVNLQGYGENVVTCGYGYLFEVGADHRQDYTNTFSGTSSASPIVTGAVAAIQGIYKERYGATLDADHIRDILIATGSPQQPNEDEHIGPLPDIRAAEALLQPVTDMAIDPRFIDTVMAEGQLISVYVDLINTASDKTLEYTISTIDDYDNNAVSDWLIVPDPSGTIAPSGNQSLEIILDATEAVDMSMPYQGVVRINYGESGGPIDSRRDILVLMRIPCMDTSYSVTASYDQSGPEFQWIDILSVGTKIDISEWYISFPEMENPPDNGTAGPFAIGFDFPFYETVYNQVYIGANGAISLTDSNVNLNGYFGPVPIPNPPFETFISPFWLDFNMIEEWDGHGDVYHYCTPSADSFIIEYYQMGNHYSAYDTAATFEIILTRNGNITFQYLSTGFSTFSILAEIGIAEHDCAHILYYMEESPPDHAPAESTVVLFDYAFPIWEQAGDVNDDNDVNVADAVFLINYIFKGGPPPIRKGEGDANCDGGTNVADAVYIINYVFRSGPEPCDYAL
jgi:subtilisin family serine protease